MSEPEKVNILMVDDQPAKLLSYEVILGELGENLLKAGSAKEALEHLLKTDIAIVLMDVSMPELDGFELAALIRQHPRYQQTAILFISGVHLTDLDLLKGYEHGAVDYITVPVVPEILRAKVRVFADLYRKTHQLAQLNQELEQRVSDRTAALQQAHATLEKRVQERTAELAAANEEVRRFAYIVSHDLRAPLINLKGFSSELRTACDVLQATMPAVLPHLEAPQRAAVSRALDQDIPEALGFIDTSVTRMDHLIRAMLHLSRLGRRELDYEPLDMLALVRGTVQTLAHQIAQRQVQVTVESLPTVIADRTAMEQIMGNLLANAVAYLAPGRPGEIIVTAERCPEATVLHVRDNGRGIAAEDIPKVFEPLRRVGTQDVPGEGMGLAYVQMLVRRHGGDIQCHSTLGVGTTFTFTIAHQLTGGEAYAC